jgi:hypothetical protein
LSDQRPILEVRVPTRHPEVGMAQDGLDDADVHALQGEAAGRNRSEVVEQ